MQANVRKIFSPFEIFNSYPTSFSLFNFSIAMNTALAWMIDEARIAIVTCGMLDGTKGAKQHETRMKAATCIIAMWSHSGKLRALADRMSSFKNGVKFTEKSFAGAARRTRKDADLWMYLFVVASGCGELGGQAGQLPS